MHTPEHLPKVKNAEALSGTPARADLIAIAEAGLEAIDTHAVIRKWVSLDERFLTVGGESILRSSYRRLLVAAVGKCALDAAEELEAILGDEISDGVAVDLRCDLPLRHIRSCAGTHPLPTQDNIDYTEELITLLKSATEEDLVITVISGGGSTLLCQPKTHTCDDERVLLEYLFSKGATIAEINIIRKHLSLARGGNLAAAAYPARMVALVFSDVPGNDIATIASGPTLKDETTIDDARELLNRFDALDAIGFSPKNLVETPKEDRLFESTTNVLVLTNRTMLEAMAEAARAKGYVAEIKDTRIEGEARDVARRILTELHDTPSGTVYLYGGETTVTVGANEGHGQGGRNHELALWAIPDIKNDEMLLAFSSDGRDNGPHAGAIADTISKAHADEKGLDPVAFGTAHDSATFFSQTGDFLETGMTGANVSDAIILVKHA